MFPRAYHGGELLEMDESENVERICLFCNDATSVVIQFFMIFELGFK